MTAIAVVCVLLYPEILQPFKKNSTYNFKDQKHNRMIKSNITHNSTGASQIWLPLEHEQ